jgi:hypothetical protein
MWNQCRRNIPFDFAQEVRTVKKTRAGRPRPHCHFATPALCHTGTLPHWHFATLALCHTATATTAALGNYFVSILRLMFTWGRVSNWLTVLVSLLWS